MSYDNNKHILTVKGIDYPSSRESLSVVFGYFVSRFDLEKKSSFSIFIFILLSFITTI